MAYHRLMLGTLTLVLGVVVLAQDKIYSIGPCTTTVLTDYFMNLTQFVEENNGIWSYFQIPKTKNYEDIERMSVVFKKTDTTGKYDVAIYYQRKGKEPRTLMHAVLHDSYYGHATIYATLNLTDIQYKMSIIKYVPKQFAMYYVCSENGGDINMDYRYAMGHKDLTDEQMAFFNSVQGQYNFKGEMMKLIK